MSDLKIKKEFLNKTEQKQLEQNQKNAQLYGTFWDAQILQKNIEEKYKEKDLKKERKEKRKLDEYLKRKIEIKVRLNELENEKLEKVMKKFNEHKKPTAVFIRDEILNLNDETRRNFLTPDVMQVFKSTNENLAKIGGLLNQIAHAMNVDMLKQNYTELEPKTEYLKKAYLTNLKARRDFEVLMKALAYFHSEKGASDD